IEVPHWKSVDDNTLCTFLLSEYKRLLLPFKRNSFDVEMSDFKGKPNRLKELRNIIKRRGGKLLSDVYTKTDDKNIKLQCKCGNIYLTKPHSLFYSNGTRCYKCRLVKD
ncbi:hypothetical protein LCGC14_2110260, partial [marine sediment metagenome]